MKKLSYLENEENLVKLLQFQNRVLVDLYNKKVEEEANQKRELVFKIIVQALPWLILILVVIWLYNYVNGVLLEVNSKIDYVKNGYDSVVKSIQSQTEIINNLSGTIQGGIGQIGNWFN